MDVSMLILQLSAGLAAGVITTVGGMGGGLTLLLVLSVAAGPMMALTWTAPALLLGNLHRSLRYRESVHKPLAKRLVVGGLLGSLLGALVAVQLPPLVLQLGVVGMTALALLNRFTSIVWRVPTRLIVPITFGNGAICASTGGAGLLTAPLLMAAGLSGEAWIATNSVGAVSMHAGRLLGYGAGGLITAQGLLISGLLAMAIMAGNEVGVGVRRRLGDGGLRRFESGVMVIVVLMSVAGVAKVARGDGEPTAARIESAPSSNVVAAARLSPRWRPGILSPLSHRAAQSARGVSHEQPSLSPPAGRLSPVHHRY